YGPSLMLSPTGGTVATTTIYARFTPSATGTTPGTVSVTSPGATTRIVNLTGTISTGGGTGGSSDDGGGGGCNGSNGSLPWLLLLALLALPTLRRRAIDARRPTDA